jgi:hypothetical protein
MNSQGMVVHMIICWLEKVLNAQSLLLRNLLKSKRLARFSVRRVGHTLKITVINLGCT